MILITDIFLLSNVTLTMTMISKMKNRMRKLLALLIYAYTDVFWSRQATPFLQAFMLVMVMLIPHEAGTPTTTAAAPTTMMTTTTVNSSSKKKQQNKLLLDQQDYSRSEIGTRGLGNYHLFMMILSKKTNGLTSRIVVVRFAPSANRNLRQYSSQKMRHRLRLGLLAADLCHSMPFLWFLESWSVLEHTRIYLFYASADTGVTQE